MVAWCLLLFLKVEVKIGAGRGDVATLRPPPRSSEIRDFCATYRPAWGTKAPISNAGVGAISIPCSVNVLWFGMIRLLYLTVEGGLKKWVYHVTTRRVPLIPGLIWTVMWGVGEPNGAITWNYPVAHVWQTIPSPPRFCRRVGLERLQIKCRKFRLLIKGRTCGICPRSIHKPMLSSKMHSSCWSLATRRNSSRSPALLSNIRLLVVFYGFIIIFSECIESLFRCF